MLLECRVNKGKDTGINSKGRYSLMDADNSGVRTVDSFPNKWFVDQKPGKIKGNNM